MTVSNGSRPVSGWPRWTLALAGLLLFAGGCSEEAPIRTYTVPEMAEIDGAPSPDTPTTPQRMLGAILPGEDRVWYFKLMGDADEVLKHVSEFGEFMRSVNIDANGEPTWSLPEGWRQEAGSGMRFATIRIGDDSRPIELTVIPLASDDPASKADLLANINRWRGQVGLEPFDESDLDTPSDEIQQITANGRTVTLVNFVGEAPAGGAPMSPPFATPSTTSDPSEAPMAESRPQTPQPSDPADSGLTYDVPEGWQPGRAGGIRKAAFEIRDGDQMAEVTVIDLAREVSPLLPNINRWRGQVGLEEWSEDEANEKSTPIAVGDLEGTYVALHGTGPNGNPQSILGVIVYSEDRAWFIKMTGDTPLAKQNEEKFREFANSLKIAR